MSEPASAFFAGSTVVKVAAAVFGVTGVALVVMIMTQPVTRREWAVALISTVVASICGGAAVIQYYGLAAWQSSFDGSLALAGLHFVCGLPAWVAVRGYFAWTESNARRGLPDLIREIRRAIKGGRDDA